MLAVINNRLFMNLCPFWGSLISILLLDTQMSSSVANITNFNVIWCYTNDVIAYNAKMFLFKTTQKHRRSKKMTRNENIFLRIIPIANIRLLESIRLRKYVWNKISKTFEMLNILSWFKVFINFVCRLKILNKLLVRLFQFRFAFFVLTLPSKLFIKFTDIVKYETKNVLFKHENALQRVK